jgi:hypothetical protein
VKKRLVVAPPHYVMKVVDKDGVREVKKVEGAAGSLVIVTVAAAGWSSMRGAGLGATTCAAGGAGVAKCVGWCWMACNTLQ